MKLSRVKKKKNLLTVLILAIKYTDQIETYKEVIDKIVIEINTKEEELAAKNNEKRNSILKTPQVKV